jgi:hypothetical protein
LLVLLSGCFLFRLEDIPCASAENCFEGQVCDANRGICVPAGSLPDDDAGVGEDDAGDAPVDAGLNDGGPDAGNPADAGVEDAGIVATPCEEIVLDRAPCGTLQPGEGCDGELEPGYDSCNATGCTLADARTPILNEDFSTTDALLWCAPGIELAAGEDGLTGDAELNLGFIPGHERVELRLVVQWAGAGAEIISASFNAELQGQGTGFKMERFGADAVIHLQRSAAEFTGLTYPDLPAGLYFIELLNRVDKTMLTISRDAFGSDPAADIVQHLEVPGGPEPPSSGTRLFLAAGPASFIDRFELNRGPLVDPLLRVQLWDSFTRGTVGSPDFSHNGTAWVNADGNVSVDGTSATCAASCDDLIYNSALGDFRARFAVPPLVAPGSLRVRIGEAGFDAIEGRVDVLAPASNINLPADNPLFYELRSGPSGAGLLVVRNGGFNGPLAAFLNVDRTAVGFNQLQVNLGSAAALDGVYIDSAEPNDGAALLFDDFDEPETRGITLIPGDAWPSTTGIGDGTFSGTVPLTYSFDVFQAVNVRARYVIAPGQPRLGAILQTSNADAAVDLDFDTDALRLQGGTGSREVPLRTGPGDTGVLYVEHGVKVSNAQQTYVTVRRDSFVGEVVRALHLLPPEPPGIISGVSLSALTGEVDSVEVALVPQARPRDLLLFDSFSVEVTPDGDMTQELPEALQSLPAILEVADGALQTTAAVNGLNITLKTLETQGTNVRLRAQLTVPPITSPTTLEVILNANVANPARARIDFNNGTIQAFNTDGTPGTVAAFSVANTLFLELVLLELPDVVTQARISSVGYTDGELSSTGSATQPPGASDEVLLELTTNDVGFGFEEIVVERVRP